MVANGAILDVAFVPKRAREVDLAPFLNMFEGFLIIYI